jgi:hypothetical protein
MNLILDALQAAGFYAGPYYIHLQCLPSHDMGQAITPALYTRCWSYCDVGVIVPVHASVQLCHGWSYPHCLNLCMFSGAVDEIYPAPIIQISSYCDLNSIYLQKFETFQNQQTWKHGFLTNMMEITPAYLHSPIK